MAKRIITKIGDVYYADLGNGWKGYFQYVAIDQTVLNSNVIRVFKKRYKTDENPSIEEIIKDEVQFYAHTFLRPGIYFDYWHKVGKSNDIKIEEVKKVWFGLADDTDEDWKGRIIDVDPRKHWRIWHLNENEKKIGRLPKKYRDIVEYGAAVCYLQIFERMKYGYYKYNSRVFDELKRVPLSHVHSYLKVCDGSSEIYYHYLGDTAIQQVLLSDGKLSRLIAGENLDLPKFHEINWDYDDFISEEEFMMEWNKYCGGKDRN